MSEEKSPTERVRELLENLVDDLERLGIRLDHPGSEMTLGEHDDEREKAIGRCADSIKALFGPTGKTCRRVMLTAEQVREAVMSVDRWEKPMGNTELTNTHLIIRDDGWQTIADELNATVGEQTCKPTKRTVRFSNTQERVTYYCECGEELGGYYVAQIPWYHTYNETPIPNHCPKCGKRIEASE